ncbi:ABC transporter ATP-binding protein [Psittacicella gerlachiana]|nr:ABC transporter ATP-binding protein [Psittacicella gerlachiana]
MTKNALVVENLKVTFGKKGSTPTLKNISFTASQGKILGVVGESGSGKSVTSLAILDLLGKTATIEADKIEVNDIDFLKLTTKQKRPYLGKTISYVFQDALNALDPTYTIGQQIIETLVVHEPGKSNKEYQQMAVELLNKVGILDPESRLSAYPHQLSGGQLQRIMIGIAISSNPKILIADEPTTALDVIIQKQIVDLLLQIQKENNMTMIFISHNLALISEIADQIIVMRKGEIVEQGSVDDIFLSPKRDYTRALISSLPQFAKNLQPIAVEQGN